MSDMTTVGDFLRQAREQLRSHGIHEIEARWLVAAALQIAPIKLDLHLQQPLAPQAARQLTEWIQRRCRHEPLQYILGTTFFMGLELRVGPGVLIPRPETEILVEKALQAYPGRGEVLDLCTGSGCIPLAIAAQNRQIPAITGTDISPEAIAWAKRNRRHLKLERVFFACGDLFEPVRGMRFSLITVNPPYIAESEKHLVSPEVHYEPPIALWGGDHDGLGIVRRIVEELPAFLEPAGTFLCEVGWKQARQVATLLQERGFTTIHIFTDQQGIERVIQASL